MSASLWKSPFPPLQLTGDEKKELLGTVDTIVNEMLESHAEFLQPEPRPHDPALWTVVKERERLCVYQSKLPGGGTTNEDMHLLMTTGTLVGSFHDVMYGMINHSTEEMRLRSSYIQDKLSNGAVLATVLSPTEEQPFQSVTIRWRVKRMPLYARTVAKNRDAVYIDALGTRKLPNGDMVGYSIRQSVAFKTAPPLAQCDRVSLSTCTLWKEVRPNLVRIVTRFYCLLKDCSMESATLRSFAEGMVSLWQVVLWAQRKKLVWLTQNRDRVELEHRARDEAGTCCVVCGDMLSDTRRSLACAVCAKPTCKKCRILHDLKVPTPDGDIVDQRTRFCVACVSVASRLDASDVARDEIPRSSM